jgi:hypothetical protein
MVKLVLIWIGGKAKPVRIPQSKLFLTGQILAYLPLLR